MGLFPVFRLRIEGESIIGDGGEWFSMAKQG
jgi:hypothetical protein